MIVLDVPRLDWEKALPFIVGRIREVGDAGEYAGGAGLVGVGMLMFVMKFESGAARPRGWTADAIVVVVGTSAR